MLSPELLVDAGRLDDAFQGSNHVPPLHVGVEANPRDERASLISNVPKPNIGVALGSKHGSTSCANAGEGLLRVGLSVERRVGLVPEPVDLVSRREEDLKEFCLPVNRVLDGGLNGGGLAKVATNDTPGKRVNHWPLTQRMRRSSNLFCNTVERVAAAAAGQPLIVARSR